MQNTRIVVPNSHNIEERVYKLSENELGYRQPVTRPAVVQRLVRDLNSEYGIRLSDEDISGQDAFRIAGIVQRHLFGLQSEQEKAEKPEDLTEQALSAVARVITTALNEKYGLKLRPAGIRNVSVEQLCERIVRLQRLRR